MDRCDLHTHSIFSDGTCTPETLCQQAKLLGLKSLALTDHNTTAGLHRFCAAGRALSMEPVPGVELTTQLGPQELHLLALFLPEQSMPEAEAFCLGYNEAKTQQELICADRLQAAGYPVSRDALLALSHGRTPNRVQIAQLLMQGGAAVSISDAFDHFLCAGGGFYTPPPRPSILHAIEAVHTWGAVAVWAHPRHSVPRQTAAQLLPLLAAHGLDGLETRYSTYTSEDTSWLAAQAQALDLLESGGSDYHGGNKPSIQLGSGQGNLVVPQIFCNALRARANQ